VLLCIVRCRWLQSVDCQPGINCQALDYLCQMRTKSPEQYTRCAFMLDAMSIRQQVSYNGHTGRICGFVDLGSNEETDDEAHEIMFSVSRMRLLNRALSRAIVSQGPTRVAYQSSSSDTKIRVDSPKRTRFCIIVFVRCRCACVRAYYL